MSNPADMVLGADGNLYVTDTGNNRVIQVVNPSTASPTVTVINIGSSGGTLNPPLTAPMGIFETSDEVYVTDMPPSGPRLVAFRPDGSFPTTVLGSRAGRNSSAGTIAGDRGESDHTGNLCGELTRRRAVRRAAASLRPRLAERRLW